jgi:pimeloyl-ACP methyl ester carboxylesterase
VPTLHAWGDEDSSVGRAAAEATAGHVAGPCVFKVMRGVGHFSTDQAPRLVSEMLLEHIGAHPCRPADESGDQ